VSAALADTLRRHAAALARGDRSPLYRELMLGAAADAQAGGLVADLFANQPVSEASVPALRLMAALHRLVLDGAAPALAAYFPSVGGERPPDGAWPVAAATLTKHAPRVRELLPRTVQTNEPGRSTVLYGGLLWLTERYGLPVRLLEIGASAGLNLLVERYGYRVGPATLGDPGSPLCFAEPWRGTPVADPVAVARRLEIVERAGCDPAPLRLDTEDGRRMLLAYVWPDERERWRRVHAAVAVAEREPPRVDAAPAGSWLRERLAAPAPGRLTVVWQSVMRQYLGAAERARIEQAIARAGAAAGPDAPVAWLAAEPDAGLSRLHVVSVRSWPDGETRELARSGDHGPPVRWA
jgi:hypothetical protein